MAKVAGFMANVSDRYHPAIWIQAGYFIYTVFSIVIGDLAIEDGLLHFVRPRGNVFN
jgi:hypothetical protein